MDSMLQSAIFTILGSFIAVAAAYFFAKAERDWAGMKRDIVKLTEQVEAYHCLEAKYIAKHIELDPNGGAGRTIMAGMRDRVSEEDKVARPEMTAQQAKRIRDRWA